MFPFPLWAPEPALSAPLPKESPADALFRKAKNLRYAQNWFEAAAVYRQILRDYPTNSRLPEVQFWLAATLESDQRWDEAARAYTEFLNQHPGQEMLGREAKLNRIHCWGIRQGQDPEATPGLAAALGDPVDDVQLAAALQLSKKGDRRAVEALQKGMQTAACAEPCRLALLSMGIEPRPPESATSGRFLVLRIQEKGKPDVVTIRLAMGLAKAVAGYLSDAQIRQAKHKGMDPDHLMDLALKAPKGTVLLSVDDKESSITITSE